MKVLTASEMRVVDQRSIVEGIPDLVLMENAGHRVVEFLAEKFAPLESQHVVIFCGKGKNGGDGLVVARQLFSRFKLRALEVVLVPEPEELSGEVAENYRMFLACGGKVQRQVSPAMYNAGIVVDALLGTGIQGAARGPILDAIRQINMYFPLARVVAVDIPSGQDSDSGQVLGESVRAAFTVTFTAPKLGTVLPPNCDTAGELHIGLIGSRPEWYEDDPRVLHSVIQPRQFYSILAPRAKGTHKGTFGHVLVVGGSEGKTGAPAMTAMAALRAGAGLVTVSSTPATLQVVAAQAPEIMTEPLNPERFAALAKGKDVLALGPGLGNDTDLIALVRNVVEQVPQPIVVDADGLNALAGVKWSGAGKVRILTPHPGEMARLTHKTVRDVQNDRVGTASTFAAKKEACVVLKGQRTLIAFPDGRVWINPTGTPAMATAGAGDILTGLIAAFLAQFPKDADQAVAAAVYLHGLAGELGAAQMGEKSLIATDLLRFLPAALEECAKFPDRL